MAEKVTQTNTEDNFLDDVANAVMSDSGDFFENLDQSVNGVIADPGTGAPQDNRVTQDLSTEAEKPQDSVNPDSERTKTVDIDWDSDDNPYKKRYADSSRENTKNQQALEENQQYNAIINVMKKDPNLVETVRDYLENGPKRSPKEQLGLSEDFIFDPEDAFGNPNSESAQVFEKVVNRIVDQKTQQTESKMANAMKAENDARTKRALANKWMQENNMSEEEFATMMDKANKHEISYDDINLILNKDKFAKKVASNQKKDVAQQIANVRKSATPQVSGTGSVDATEISVEDKIFDSLRNLDSQDNLFDS
tara:strand:+ start:1478 stop:2404 length:927 start_codon:yes stop_codon:yes gene_type:complete